MHKGFDTKKVSKLNYLQNKKERKISGLGCSHFESFFKTKKGQLIIEFINKSEKELSFSFNQTQINKYVSCPFCKRLTNRISKCLDLGCQTMGCFNCMLEHLDNSNHDFSYCFSKKLFICRKCRNYVGYDNHAKELLLQFNKEKMQYLGEVSKNTEFIGLRGLYNLGSTCFMNTVVQSLSHNPLLRNFFLGLSNPSKDDMVSKELKHVFQELYTGNIIPYNPHTLLYVIWKCAGHIAGYSQQDAHEFLMALLNGINSSKVVDFVFKGELRSDIVCSGCGARSATHDPFYDVSLHLKKYAEDENGDNRIFKTVKECLSKFTNKENLSEKITCDKCKKKQIKIKQLSFEKLPLVLTFHLKRFEQGFGRRRKKSHKIDNFITFDCDMDMFPFSSESVIGRKKSSKTKVQYSLFSVIRHSGSMDTGHYTNYVKHKGKWYLCDDEKIYYAKEEDVLNSQAYLLFYCKRELNYC